jgi:hypothetical protein
MSGHKGKGGCGCGGNGIAPVTGKSSGGCGCGGGAKASCGCGGRGCATCGDQGFVRPIFFGGQLLTEDDLQALVNYVVGKNRLHNRALFGDGVVCGLEVTCDPCDCSKLVVKAGYALDCCGNDIVVECPVTVDVNQLVRELRAKQLGADCGDSFKDRKKSGGEQPGGNAIAAVDPAMAEAATATSAPAEATPPATTPFDDGKVPKPPERYCLYIRYCEVPAEPVAPYATDDCSPSGCRSSRLKEGYTFELRCEERAPERAATMKPLVSDYDAQHLDPRGLDCLRNPKQVQQTIRDGEWTRDYLVRGAAAVAKAEAGDPIPVPSLEAKKKAIDALNERLQKPTKLTDAEAIDMAGLLRDWAVQAARERLAGDDSKGDDKGPIGKSVDKKIAARILVLAGPLDRDLKVVADTMQNKLPATFESDFAQALIKGTIGRLRADLPSGSEEPLFVRTLAHGELIDAGALRAAGRVGEEMLLQAREVTTATRTNCVSRKRLDELAGRRPILTGDPYGRIEAVRGWTQEARRDYAQIYVQCLCKPVLTTCPPCDDPAVLLACLEVRDCCVETVCNLQRNFVITGPNIRHWEPKIDAFFERERARCCPVWCETDGDLIHQIDNYVYKVQSGWSVAGVTEQSVYFLNALRPLLTTAPPLTPPYAPAPRYAPTTRATPAQPAPTPAVVEKDVAALVGRLESLEQRHQELLSSYEELKASVADKLGKKK